MRIGLVSPYAFDVPGGVQLHVRDLAEYLVGAGHDVSVLTPADDETALPPYAVSVGGAVPVRYNGSVARLAFGPRAAARVGRWLSAGDFDVIHVHEPISPSASMLALWAWDGPSVATFHTSNERSRALQLAQPLLRPGLEKIAGRIAVSTEARRTVTAHLGGDAVVIPNGVYVDRFARAPRVPRWLGTTDRPTIAFLGRMNEPRKGLSVLLDALPAVQQRHPGVRVLVAGPGDPNEALAARPAATRAAVEMLGLVSDTEKASLLASCDLYVAPNTGGESFGIILIEAMSAGAPVVASNLDAFTKVLDGGAAGVMFEAGDAASLAAAVSSLLADPVRRDVLSRGGHRRARLFDWSVVADRVVTVYETVLTAQEPDRRPWRLVRRGPS